MAPPPSSKSSDTLFVGNLSPDVTASELMGLVARYSPLDCLTLSYSSSRSSFAFLFFRRVRDAKAAKLALRGAAHLHGSNPLRIEFARLAKPCKQLWVGGVGSSVRMEELEARFRSFGRVEDFRFFRDRNTAYVEFVSLEEATRAVKAMNGKPFGGENIRVDFLRSTIRDLLADYGQFQARSQRSQISMGRDGQPSNILWISFPPPLHIDEQMLHNAMILFGEIERIKSFPSRHCLLVEFRSVDEARCAKDGLQGQFIDPRITIMYLSSELAPGIDCPDFNPGTKGPQPDVLLNEHPFQPLQLDGFGHNHPLANTDDHRLRHEQTSPINPVTDGVHGSFHPEFDHTWRGIIAKGGTPVCCARCVPIGKGIGTELPDVVDCTARTGLDMLAMHSANAIGFDIAFFLPDSEDDFVSFTKFIHYLKQNNRAGVANLVDGTALFLIPPSDFLTKVLKVTGPERVYGVVFKFPVVPSSTPMQKSMHSIHPEHTSPNALSASQAGVALTPELISTLTSLFPATTQSSVSEVAKTVISSSSTVKSPFPSIATIDGNQSHHHQIVDLPRHPHQQFGSGYDIPSAQYRPSLPSSTHGLPAQAVSCSSYFQDTAASLQLQRAVSSRSITNCTIPCQSGQVAVFSQGSQQYQAEVSSSTQKVYEMVQRTDASLLSASQTFQKHNNLFSSSSQAANPSQQLTVMPYSVDKVNSELPNLQLQSALSGVGQGSSEVEADKNQRYQSSLKFARNLLLQIQQQQTQGVHEPGNRR